MLEKDIENLIASYPEEFFPKSKLTLIGQQVKLGTCRADIMFSDEHDRKIIIEVKRGILSRDAAGQVMEYYGLLKQREPDAIIELIVCANTIPHERKLFLEKVGIECKELGISLIQKIADRYNYEFIDNNKQKTVNDRVALSPSINTESLDVNDTLSSVWIFQGNPNRYDVVNALSDPKMQRYCWQVNQHKQRIKKGDIGIIWMSGKEAGIYAVAEILTDPAIMAEPPTEEQYWVSDNDKGVKRLRVELSNRTVLINNPLYRTDLKAKDGLSKLSILQVAQGTNFPVTHDEWHVIKGLIDEKIKARK